MFDFGSGSQLNFTALEIPYEAVTGYFLTHLHADHAGDFPNVGWWMGRRSLESVRSLGAIWCHPGTRNQAFVETQISSWTWDTSTCTGLLTEVGQHAEVHEFDYALPLSSMTATAFDIFFLQYTSCPVSYRLEWNGRVFVFSGDTTPSCS